MDNFMEKYFNLTDPYIEYDIKKYLANGWIIHHQGLTLLILRKYTEV